MALSRPIGWLRDQRGDAVGLATADPLFQGGETKPTGYVATYSPVFTAEQVQQEIKEASMALSRDCRHGRQIGKCADCDYQRAPTSGATLRSMIEGMSVSVDVSTGDHDAGHRYFGTVTEVMECQGDKHGVTLLVQDAEPNFAAPTPRAAIDAARKQGEKQ